MGEGFGGMSFGDGASPFMFNMGGTPGGRLGRSKSFRERARDGFRSRSRPTRQTPTYAIPNGTSVLIHGLTQSTVLNGKRGKIASWDENRGRYEVQLDATQNTVSVRPRNVTQLCDVVVTGLTSKPELNGVALPILRYDELKGRY